MSNSYCSCGNNCGHDPDDCENETCHELPPGYTFCDGDKTNNVWVEDGVCMLDSMNDEQVTNILTRSEVARADLLRVTSCDCLHRLASTVPRLPPEEPADLQKASSHEVPSLPFYTVYRGNCSDR